jgi:Uncharacterized protein conserved in bacteria
MQYVSYLGYFPYILAGAAVLAFLAVLGMILFIFNLGGKRRIGDALTRIHGQLEQEKVLAATLQARLEDRNATIEEMQKRNDLLERNLMDANAAKAALQAEVFAADKARKEQSDLLASSETRLREAFAALSNEALGKNNEMFLALAKTKFGEFNKAAAAELEERKTAVDQLVKPIGETLGRMRTALDEAEKVRISDHGKIMALHQNLSLETGRLTRALSHSSARGHWGELQLRRVVEMAGMLDHCDFDQQVSTYSAEGNRMRPDMVVRLAGGRNIIIDAKAPMDNYLRSQETEDRRAEAEFLALHAKDVRSRIGELASKAYWSAFEESPEFVVMFFPSEGVFSDALKYDADLIDFAASNNVIPASPVTLIALLRAVAYGWRQQKATENAQYIFTLARDLHDRFSKEYQHMSALGSSLTKAVDSFNKCAGSAERKLFPGLRKFSSLVEKDLFPCPAEIENQPRAVKIETEMETTEEPLAELEEKSDIDTIAEITL